MDPRNESILRFLRETVDPSLTMETELVESGLLDSFKTITLVAFIESEFQVRVEPSDLTRVDLATAVAICRFVEKLQNNVPAT